jgi:hypothetical protein
MVTKFKAVKALSIFELAATASSDLPQNELENLIPYALSRLVTPTFSHQTLALARNLPSVRIQSTTKIIQNLKL